MSHYQKLWLSPAEAAGVIGAKPDAIYRDIRQGQFPFEFVRIGKRIKISARSLGLISARDLGAIPDAQPKTEKSEARTGGINLAVTTPGAP